MSSNSGSSSNSSAQQGETHHCEDSSSSSSNSSSSSSSEAPEVHGSASGECLVCYDDITEETYCEYSVKGDSKWHASLFCYPCVQQLQQSQFKRYCDGVSNSTCAKEQRALLKKGPPINLSDAHAFPAAAGAEIEALWLSSSKQVVSAKLKDSLTGEAREKLWNELRAFLIDGEQTEEPKDPTS